MLRTKEGTRPVSNPVEGVWHLYSSSGKLIETFKSREALIEYNTQIEILKIRRAKALEQLYSRYKGLSLYGVN